MPLGEELQEGFDAVPEFAKKRAAIDELVYATDVAEDKDLAYLIENSCIYCNKLMDKSEVKILPPSYVQERDSYVSRGIVKRRLMCMRCYNALKSTAREKVRFDKFRGAGRMESVRAAVGRLLANR